MPRSLNFVSFPWWRPFTKSGASLRKMPYTVQKNVCIALGSRVRFAVENVLRFTGAIPRSRESSRAYIFETSIYSAQKVEEGVIIYK